jgi:hypothetical protein
MDVFFCPEGLSWMAKHRDEAGRYIKSQSDFIGKRKSSTRVTVTMRSTTIPLVLRRWQELFKGISSLLIFFLFFSFYGCATLPRSPEQVDNVCEIFRENPKWYRAAHKSYKRWAISIPILMAFVHQESRFRADAKPPRTKCLCIFPGPRPSSAYGYAQASNETWKQYQDSTGNIGADRDDFGDAVDFIGWYCHVSHTRCGIDKNDAYHLYLAYHEGHGGFLRKTYNKKKWLLSVARKVQNRANTYKGQLVSCEKEFQRRGLCCFFWPF